MVALVTRKQWDSKKYYNVDGNYLCGCGVDNGGGAYYKWKVRLKNIIKYTYSYAKNGLAAVGIRFVVFLYFFAALVRIET